MGKSKLKKIIKIVIFSIVAIFLLINIAIIIQAYSLTHFKENAKPITPDYKPTLSETIGIAVFGMDIPKPEAKEHPDRPYKTLHFTDANGRKLEAWLLTTDSVKQGLAIIFHGYMDEKSRMLDRAYVIADMGYNVMLVDLMGSGGSSGTQTTIGFFEAENVKAAHDYAITELHEDKIVLFGFSMGAVAIMKAQHDYSMYANAIILEAPYGTFKGTIEQRLDKLHIPHWPASTLFTFWAGTINGFNAFEANPQDYGRKIFIPTLLMCGGKDQYIPTEETQLIFTQLSSNKKTIKIFPESLHESYLLKYPDEWKSTVYNFLHKLELLDVYNEE